MLDAFKIMTGGKNKLVQKQIEELELLVSAAREERSAISAMLTAMTARSATLAPLGKTLEQVSDQTAEVAARLDEITRRLTVLDDRTKALAALDERIQSLQQLANHAEQTTRQALGPDGELRKHRELAQHLSSQTLGTQATLETLKKERASLDELRGQLQKSNAEVKQSLAQSNSLKAELEQVRVVAAALTQDYAAMREMSRDAREDTAAAMTTAKEIENKLAPLARLNELSRSAEERLTALNALAEHVSHKAKVLDTQQQSVEHAVVQANRVNEMVWAMEVQIAKLNDGMKQVARVDDTLARTEKLTAETTTQLEAANKLRRDTEIETGKVKREAGSVLDAIRGRLETLSLKKNEFEAFDLRLRALHSGVGDAEARMAALTARDKHVIELTQAIDAISKRFETLAASADDLSRKQLALESLGERLGQVDDLAKKTAWQLDSLRQSRQDLDILRHDIQEFYKSHTDIANLAETLGAERVCLEAVAERLTAFSKVTPELEANLNAILGKLNLVDQGTQKASQLHETTAELDAQISRVSARVPFVERLEMRLNDLRALSADVDGKLDEAMARRTELEALKIQCEGLAAQTQDAQHKVDAVRAMQKGLVPVVADVNTLKEGLATAAKRLDEMTFTEAALIEQKKRYVELNAASRDAATNVAKRTRQMQALGEELARAAKMKDEILVELNRVQAKHRDTIGQTQAADDQLQRAEETFRQLELRRTQMVFGEKKLEAIESRMAQIKHIAAELDKSIAAIASREALINAVKAEVDGVHEISTRSRADLDHVIEHRGEVTALRSQVDLLLSRIGDTDERIAAVDAKRKLVDEVETKANAIVHLLDDVRINLDTLGEQKAVVDHVAEKVAQLEYALQEARNTLRALQHERELAERIEQGIKQLRSKTAKSADGKKSA